MTTPTLEAERTGQLIAAAERHAEAYDGDDRECIKTDVINAFYAGSEWERRRTAAPVAEGVALPPLDAETVRDSTWRNLLDAVLREFPRNMGRSNNGNAPGHCHSRPGIWDDDNGAIAGKPCAWCIAWNGAAQAIAAAPSPLPPKEEANG